MKKRLLAVACASGLLAVPLSPVVAARTDKAPRGWVAHKKALAAYDDLLEKMNAHAQRTPVPPDPGHGSSPAKFDEVSNVMQISRDRIDGPRGSQDDTQIEPDIAVDPNDEDVLVAVFQQGRFQWGGSVAPGFATSHDGGATWTTDALPHLTRATGGEFPRASDPVVTIGPDGSVYAQTLVLHFGKCRSGVAVQRSDDGGLTWRHPVLVQDDSRCRVANDKNWIAVDTYKKSPYYGRIYSAWTRFGNAGGLIVLRYSDDRGQTWSRLEIVSPRRGQGGGGIDVIPVVQPSGAVTLTYLTFSGVEVSQTSFDGGDTFRPPVRVARVLGTTPRRLRAFPLPSATIDPVTGTMFVAWHDSRWRRGRLNDVAMSRSDDGGRSWTKPTRVNQDRLGTRIDHVTPDIAANKGYVHVTYLTRSNVDGASRFMRQRYIVSADQGSTFGGELVLGPRINLDYAATVYGGKVKFLGDYMGLAATPKEAHPVWTRSSKDGPDKGGKHQTSWSATIGR